MGPGEGEPVLVQWRWYYNVPSLGLWVLLLLLAVVPKHNRKPQAWLILCLPLAVAGFFLLYEFVVPQMLYSDSVGQFVTALAIAWTCVWLVGPWLGSGNPLRSSCMALGVMFGAGLVGYLGYCGLWFSSEVTWPMVGCWVVGCVPLVASTLLTGVFCRGPCGAQPLLLWPILWLPVACVTSMVVFVVILALTQTEEGFSGAELLLTALVPALIASPFVAAALYVLNLPVVMLCIFASCYRQRFEETFCPEDRDGFPGQPVSNVVKGESPFASQVPNELPTATRVLSGADAAGSPELE